MQQLNLNQKPDFIEAARQLSERLEGALRKILRQQLLQDALDSFAIYGAGLSGALTYYAASRIAPVKFILDKNKKLLDGQLFDARIISPETYQAKSREMLLIATSPYWYPKIQEEFLDSWQKKAVAIFVWNTQKTKNQESGDAISLNFDYKETDLIRQQFPRLMPILQPDQIEAPYSIMGSKLAGVLSAVAAQEKGCAVNVMISNERSQTGKLYHIPLVHFTDQSLETAAIVLNTLSSAAESKEIIRQLPEDSVIHNLFPLRLDLPPSRVNWMGFSLDRLLGIGTTGRVFEASDANGKKYTLKIFHKPFSCSALQLYASRFVPDSTSHLGCRLIEKDDLIFALYYPDSKLRLLDYDTFYQTGFQNKLLSAYLRYQQRLTAELGLFYSEHLLSDINVMQNSDKDPVIFDIGMNFIFLEHCLPEALRKTLLCALLSFRFDIYAPLVTAEYDEKSSEDFFNSATLWFNRTKHLLTPAYTSALGCTLKTPTDKFRFPQFYGSLYEKINNNHT